MAPRRATKTQAPALVKEPVTRTTSVLAADRPAASTDLLCQDEAQTSSGMSQALVGATLLFERNMTDTLAAMGSDRQQNHRCQWGWDIRSRRW